MDIVCCKLEEPVRFSDRMFLVFHVNFRKELFECVVSEFKEKHGLRFWHVDVYLSKRFVHGTKYHVGDNTIQHAMFLACCKAIEMEEK